jgi:hypothetical protein
MSAVLPRHVRLERKRPLPLLTVLFVIPFSHIMVTTISADRGETKSNATVDELCGAARDVW